MLECSVRCIDEVVRQYESNLPSSMEYGNECKAKRVQEEIETCMHHLNRFELHQSSSLCNQCRFFCINPFHVAHHVHSEATRCFYETQLLSY